MRCKYCFHEKYGYSNDLLDINKLEKYISLLCSEYDFSNIIGHGGEPLLAPLSFYEEIYDFCDHVNKEFLFTIQTNGTLINQEVVDFFRKRNTNFGLSFDRLNNEYTRGNTSKILDSIGLLQENGFRPGAVLVVNKTNVSNLSKNSGRNAWITNKGAPTNNKINPISLYFSESVFLTFNSFFSFVICSSLFFFQLYPNIRKSMPNTIIAIAKTEIKGIVFQFKNKHTK